MDADLDIRVAVIGHSFIRRLNDDVHSAFYPELKANFDLDQCTVLCEGSGGWRAADMGRFQTAIVPFLGNYMPNIVILQLGENDLDKDGTQPLTVASQIEDICSKLRTDFNVQLVFVCQLRMSQAYPIQCLACEVRRKTTAV